MGQTRIEWTRRRLPDGTWLPGYSWNPWWGCLKVSEECQHCYAEGIARHYGHQVWGPAATTPRRFFGEAHWQEPLRWHRQAEADGHRRSVFCASMADVFEEHPAVTDTRARLWNLIEATPMLNWLLLTKRPENILAMAPWGSGTWPDHVWIGASIGLQKRADERLPHLLAVPAVVRFVSCEPLLEPLDLTPWIACLQWVICGGESGTQARPMNPEWARALRNQCVEAGVPFFFKQWGGRSHSSGGRLLDGRLWDEMPPEIPVSSPAGMREEVQPCPARI
jgi:protein gp37